jgi:peptide/nickel transport system substrate-binding protein
MYASVDSITQTGPWQITVKLSKPDATWQYVFATTGGHIISKKYYDAHKDNFGKPDGGVLGTGPYVFKKWVTGNEIDLEKNPDYWDKESNIAISKIVYKIIPETATLLTALKAGQVDVAGISADTVDQAKTYNNVNVSISEGYQATEIAFNNQRAPFDDVNVRRAISSAVDTVSIQKNITKYDVLANALPFGTKVASFDTEDWVKFGESAPYFKYDMTKAKEFLTKSKYPNGFNCSILVDSGSSNTNAIALLLQQSLKELKINLTIDKKPFNDFVAYAYGNKQDKNGKRDYDMISWSWLSDWPDPAGYMIPLYSSANIGQGGSNYAAYSNPEVDKLLDKQNQTMDNKERTKLLQQAITIANDDAAYRVLTYPKDLFVINKKFTYTPSASWFYNFLIKDFKVN